MIISCNFQDTIVIVISFDILYNNFDSTTANLLEAGDKSIDQIQSILQSKEVKNISKQATGIVTNAAISFKNNQRTKKKANSNEKCYNYYRLGHFGCNCLLSNRQLNRNINYNKRRNVPYHQVQKQRNQRKNLIKSHLYQAPLVNHAWQSKLCRTCKKQLPTPDSQTSAPFVTYVTIVSFFEILMPKVLIL